MIRRALVAAAVAATALAALPAGPAQARACALGYQCVTTYYSDSTGTQVVGGRFEGCDGSFSEWGVRTVHKEWSETPCS
ncbi:DUF6289 family protein [Nonomuraea sp. NPDC050786]|uniref:DUF6289 family protein n=1 Tax=Nonomuraea sp. NPDC050786 TaxID=3154840 RepID=UPI0033F5315C